MPGHEIEDHSHASPMRAFEESDQFLLSAIAGGYFVEIAYIVACIAEGRVKAGVQPDGVTPRLLR